MSVSAQSVTCCGDRQTWKLRTWTLPGSSVYTFCSYRHTSCEPLLNAPADTQHTLVLWPVQLSPLDTRSLHTHCMTTQPCYNHNTLLSNYHNTPSWHDHKTLSWHDHNTPSAPDHNTPSSHDHNTLIIWSQHTLITWSQHTLIIWSQHTLIIWSQHTLITWSQHALITWSQHTLIIWPQLWHSFVWCSKCDHM